MTITHWPIQPLTDESTPDQNREHNLAIRYNLEGIIQAHRQSSHVLAWSLTQQLYDAMGGGA